MYKIVPCFKEGQYCEPIERHFAPILGKLKMFSKKKNLCQIHQKRDPGSRIVLCLDIVFPVI